MFQTPDGERRMTMGFGMAALGFGLAYEVLQIVVLLGGLAAPWGLFAVVLPSLFLAWCWLAFASLVHESATGPRRPWTRLALSFAMIYATLNSLVYVVQLAVVVPQALRGGPGLGGPFAMAAGRPLTAVNAVAYALLSVSAALLGASCRGRWTRAALFAHGALAPVILAILFLPGLMPVGGLWLVTFPLSTIALLREEHGRDAAPPSRTT